MRDMAESDGVLEANGERAREREMDDAAPLDVTQEHDGLTPSVRRLVRQYDLDITGIHGTGPSGRIRVGDVIALLGNRAEAPPKPADAARAEAQPARAVERPAADRAVGAARDGQAFAAAPASTVFDCDLGAVLRDRKKRKMANADTLLTSYFLLACHEALWAVPDLAAGAADEQRTARLGVRLSSLEPGVRTTLIESGADLRHASLGERLQALDRALRTTGDAPLDDADLLIHHYGLAGSVLALPTPLASCGGPSLGIGKLRREVVVRTVDGEEAPRIAALCYVTLTFFPDRLDLEPANRFLARVVQTLECWPAD